jgi:Transposase, Mutator family
MENRSLDLVYPAGFSMPVRVEIRDDGLVENNAVYVALALNPGGAKEILGLWIEQAEGAKFGLKVVNELKAFGVNDILIAWSTGSKFATFDNPLGIKSVGESVLNSSPAAIAAAVEDALDVRVEVSRLPNSTAALVLSTAFLCRRRARPVILGIQRRKERCSQLDGRP